MVPVRISANGHSESLAHSNAPTRALNDARREKDAIIPKHPDAAIGSVAGGQRLSGDASLLISPLHLVDIDW